MDPISDEDQLQYPFVDRVQRRYEVIRPIVLIGDRTAAQRAQETPEEVLEELARLKALYDGFGYRELARIIWHQTHYQVDDKTIKKLWQQSPVPVQGELPFDTYHSHTDRYQARLQVIKLYYRCSEKDS